MHIDFFKSINYKTKIYINLNESKIYDKKE